MSTVYSRSPQVKYQLAVAHLRNKDLPKATASLNEATALDPNYAEALLLLAQINMRKEQTAAVINSLTQLTRQRPQSAQAHLHLADAYRTEGNLDGNLERYRLLH